MKAIIQADYRTYRHVPSRSCVQLIIEVPEESFPDACKALGYPVTGQSKPVAVCLLDKNVIEETVSKSTPLDQTEGDKLRIRAVLLCRDKDFQDYISSHDFKGNSYSWHEDGATEYVRDYCNIKSRSELTHNKEAQGKFKQLDQQYKNWQTEQRYADFDR